MAKKSFSTVAALLALALLALPGRAMAHDSRHFDDDRWRSREFHDSGRHLGWFKHGHQQPPGWFKPGHREPDRDDFPTVCDEDGDDCRPNSYFHGYGHPGFFSGFAPQGGGIAQLMRQAASARAQYYAAVARGDRRSAKHLLGALRDAESRLASAQAQNGYPLSYGTNYFLPGANYNGAAPGSPAANLLAPLIGQMLNY